MRTLHLLILSFIAATALFTAGCSRHGDQWTRLDRAEALMEEFPDSALNVLDSVDTLRLRGAGERARHALLLSMALDKNYIDLTTFDTLQPAIDYYLRHGSADDRLRTYYYQARIYQNANDRNNAIRALVRAIDLGKSCKDTLTLARAYSTRSRIFNTLFDFRSDLADKVSASNLFRCARKYEEGMECLFGALNAAILMKDQGISDSLHNLIASEAEKALLPREYFLISLLSYENQYGSTLRIKQYIDESAFVENKSDYLKFAIIGGYCRLKEYDKGLKVLSEIADSGEPYDTARVYAFKYDILESTGDHTGSMEAYMTVDNFVSEELEQLIDQRLWASEEKYKNELQIQKEKELRKWGIIGGVIILILLTTVLVTIIRYTIISKELALNKANLAEKENEKLKSETSNLRNETDSLRIEKENLRIETNSLRMKIKSLEEERVSLKKSMENSADFPEEVREAVRQRIELLNTQLASLITTDPEKERKAVKLVNAAIAKSRDFMNSTRLAFKASHPKFISYFEERGLTEDDINYICLYALGLNGREVGTYMKKSGHIHTSSAIRAKLGMDRHDTNIRIFVRKMFQEL